MRKSMGNIGKEERDSKGDWEDHCEKARKCESEIVKVTGL